MNPVHDPVVPHSTSESLQTEPHGLVLADGLVAGGLAGLLTLAAAQWAPWLVMEIVGFLAAPVLLGVSVIEPPGALAAPVAIVVGSMLLYAAYALVIFRSRSVAAAMAWIGGILLLHAVCLIVWTGSAIAGLIDSLPI